MKKGDEYAFKELFFLYFQPLYLFARKFVDEDAAKDIVQDVFLDIWENHSKLEIHTSVNSYLFTVVKNRCYKFLKTEQKKKGSKAEFNLKLKQEELSFFNHSEKSILEFDVKDRIRNTYKKLPEKCCAVFMESRLKGLSNKEIAEKLNISLKTVEKHISKALQLFRKEFTDLIILIFTLLFLS